MKKKDWKKFWGEFGMDSYDSFLYLSFYKELIQKTANTLSECKTVLDVGCGTGNLAIKLAETADKVYGIDYSEGMLKKAEEKISVLDEKIKKKIFLSQQDAENLEFSNDVFDGISNINVLFNLYHPLKALKEAYRTLKKEGIFVVSGPNAKLEDEKFVQKSLEDYKNIELNLEGLESLFNYNKFIREKNGILFAHEKEYLKNILKEIDFKKITFFPDVYLDQSYFIVAEK